MAAMTRFPGRWAKKLRRTPEHDLQRSAIQWLRLALVPPAFAWSCDAAGDFGKIGGAMRKVRGIRAGQPDIWVLGPGPTLVGIELKSGKGYVSPEQFAFARDCAKCGIMVYTCWTLDDIENGLRLRGIPLRATLAPEPAAVKAARETA